jgi:glycerophosphoryl diester phosphodiesterase
MRLLIDAGVDGIMSDYPDRLLAAQKKDKGPS